MPLTQQTQSCNVAIRLRWVIRLQCSELKIIQQNYIHRRCCYQQWQVQTHFD